MIFYEYKKAIYDNRTSTFTIWSVLRAYSFLPWSDFWSKFTHFSLVHIPSCYLLQPRTTPLIRFTEYQMSKEGQHQSGEGKGSERGCQEEEKERWQGWGRRAGSKTEKSKKWLIFLEPLDGREYWPNQYAEIQDIEFWTSRLSRQCQAGGKLAIVVAWWDFEETHLSLD